jgi:hypothetical protein
MIDHFAIIVHEVLCLSILWSVFCRSVDSSIRVRTDVRVAFFLLGIVACGGIVSPIAWHYTPDLFGFALLFAMAWVQVVTAYHWSSGVPDRFYKPGCAPRKRRACDMPGKNHA